MCTQLAAVANAQGASATTFIIEHRIPQPDRIGTAATGAEDGQVAVRIEDSVNVGSGTPLSLGKRLSLAHRSHFPCQTSATRSAHWLARPRSRLSPCSHSHLASA